MTRLLVFKDILKAYYGKYGAFAIALMKFVLAYIVTAFLNTYLGFMEELNNPFVPLLVALICAFIPLSAISAVMGIYMILHVSQVSMEMAILLVVVIAVISLLYYGFQPGDSILLTLVPLLFYLRIPYVLPLILGLSGSLLSIIPISCGVVIYYIVLYVNLNTGILAGDAGADAVARYTSIINSSLSNKSMLVFIMAFAIALIVVYSIRQFSISYAWYIANGAGVIALFTSIFIGEYIFDVSMPVVGLVIGILASGVITALYIFFVFSVDYTRVERTTFEDDDYVYYVKAVPKISVSAPDLRIQIFRGDNHAGKNKNDASKKDVKHEVKETVVKEPTTKEVAEKAARVKQTVAKSDLSAAKSDPGSVKESAGKKDIVKSGTAILEADAAQKQRHENEG